MTKQAAIDKIEVVEDLITPQWFKWKKSTFQIPNDPQTPDVCRLSSGGPCMACLELAVFDALDELSDLKEVPELVEDRYLLIRKINDRHDPFSYYLPFELASKIFTIYYENTGYVDSVLSRGASIPHIPTPLRLASVCTTWRDIAFHIPSLWSYLRISYDPSYYIQSTLAAQWLGRAGTRPLSIRVALAESHEYTKRLRRSIAPLFDVIRRYSDRWKVLNLFIPSKLCKTFLGKFPLDAPLLETLQLDVTNVKYVDASPIATLVTPRLRKLHMWRLWLTTVLVDWQKLTSVRATRASVDEIFEILARSPGLTECAFSEICDNSSMYMIPPMLTHTSLRTLKLFPKDFMEDDVMSALFSRLTLPLLQRLTLDFKHSIMPLDLNTVSGFLVRSGRAVTYLSLENIEFFCVLPTFILTMLDLLPGITELSLKCWELGRFWRALPDSLFYRLGSSSLLPYRTKVDFLPNLQILTYRGSRPVNKKWEELKPILEDLACALENSRLVSGASQEYGTDSGRIYYPPRPLHTVHFTLINSHAMDEIRNLSGDVFRRLLRVKSRGIGLKITEEVLDADVGTKEIDLLQHSAWAFSEFDDFPAHWFEENVITVPLGWPLDLFPVHNP